MSPSPAAAPPTAVRAGSSREGRAERGVSAGAMNKDAASSHSFIVKIWLEESAGAAEEPVWRGRITHVPGGERRYVRDLAGITAFIGQYLQSMGVTLPLRRRLRRWLGARPGKRPPMAGS